MRIFFKSWTKWKHFKRSEWISTAHNSKWRKINLFVSDKSNKNRLIFSTKFRLFLVELVNFWMIHTLFYLKLVAIYGTSASSKNFFFSRVFVDDNLFLRIIAYFWYFKKSNTLKWITFVIFETLIYSIEYIVIVSRIFFFPPSSPSFSKIFYTSYSKL